MFKIIEGLPQDVLAIETTGIRRMWRKSWSKASGAFPKRATSWASSPRSTSPIRWPSAAGGLVAIPLVDPSVAKLQLALIANRRRTLSTAAVTFGARLSQEIRQN
jgi:hypothetical protein